MDLTKSKENIQPLRGGRNILQLTTALQAQSDSDAQKQLALQKSEHEDNIRNYVGSDPLDLWFIYIQWLEQSFPKHGHEGNMDKALKSCLAEFENDPRYIQDRRFLRLWIKYIDYQSNPLEMYQLLYNKGVGTTCSELYRAWACYCEEANDYQKADQVYNLGLKAHAQPFDELEQAHANFQLWFAQRYFHDDSPTKRKAASALAETRLALTSLRTIKRRNIAIVPSQRTGDNVRSITPGTMRQQHTGTSSQPLSNIMVDVYQDKPGPSGASSYIPQPEEGAVGGVPAVQSILQSCNSDQNQKEVGIWNNPSTKNFKNTTAAKTVAPPSFIPYEDDTLRLLPNHLPYCREDFSDFKTPICVPDPPDPTKIRKYNKKEVYKDGEEGSVEFSLEEIKSRKYLAAYKSSAAYKKMMSAINEPYRSTNTKQMEVNKQANNVSALQTLANCAIASETLDNKYQCNDQYTPPNMLGISGVTPVSHVESANERKEPESNYLNDLPAVPVSSEFNLENIIAQSNSILNAEDPHQSVVLEQNEGYTVEYIDMSKPQYDNAVSNDVAADYNMAGSGDTDYAPKKSIYADFNRSLLANVQDDSMTINTREVNREINNVFADPINNSMAPAPIVPQFEANHFEIHEDHSMTIAARGKAATCIEPPSEQGTILSENAPEYGYSHRNPQNMQPKITNFDETCSTQMFNFNIAGSSTPISNQFKKPYTIDTTKTPNIKKFNINDSSTPERGGENNCEQTGAYAKAKEGVAMAEQHYVDNNGLSTIMETTEHRSGSSSSGSYQTMRNTMFGNTRESCGPSLGVISENSHHEPHTNHLPVDPNTYARRQRKPPSTHTASNYGVPNDNKVLSVPSQMPHPVNSQAPHQYHTIDHQYHKTSNNYNGYVQQRNVSQGYPNTQPVNAGYQQTPYPNTHTNINYQNSAYPNNAVGYHQGFQQGMQSPQVQPGFQSPPHVIPGFQNQQQAVQSPQHSFNSPQHGYTSPQQGFTSPQHGYSSPQHAYATPNAGFHAPQHVYHNQSQQHQSYVSPHVSQAGFQSPPHMQGYSSPHQNFQSPPQYAQNPHVLHNSQHSYHQQSVISHNQSVANRSQYHNQSNYSNVNHSQNYAPNQSYHMQNSYSNHVKPQTANMYNNYQNNQLQSPNYSGYKTVQNSSSHTSQNHYPPNNQTPNQVQQEYLNNPQPTVNHSQYQMQVPTATPQPSPNASQTNLNQNYNTDTQQKSNYSISSSIKILANPQQAPKPPYQSPTSKLRSVRHEVPHIALKSAASAPSPAANPGFSNQFLNFISARNEPKDNANTPKFSNSPNISQKMHKNLYVSSPEQGQVPPSTDLNGSEFSKQNAAVRTPVSNQNNNTSQSISDKQKDQSKRQLDFEHRTEIQNEDSRDSVSKTSRKSSINSRRSEQSIGMDNNYQMDVDSESSMDCQTVTFKSNCSNTQLTTQELPKPANIEFPKLIDPFNRELNNSLMQYVKFPNKNHYEGYYDVKSVPKVQIGSLITLGNCSYSVEKLLGKGTFGSVYRALDCSNRTSVAIKYQKPGNPWEYYICKEIRSRVSDPYMLYGYMDINVAFFSDNASIFVSELSKYGSLLDVVKKVSQATAKCVNELIVMLLASEMLSIVHHLHKAEIIHADIKPDNFLLMEIPQTESRNPSLQLIDLGCAIDMSLYPEGTTFQKVIMTEDFTCTEMREGKPWTYQTDLYCLAGTIFLVLMGRYMKTVECGGRWNVEKKWPRYMKAAIWDKLFITLLNIKDCSSIPDLMSLKDMLDEHLRTDGRNLLSNNLTKLANVLKSR